MAPEDDKTEILRDDPPPRDNPPRDDSTELIGHDRIQAPTRDAVGVAEPSAEASGAETVVIGRRRAPERETVVREGRRISPALLLAVPVTLVVMGLAIYLMRDTEPVTSGAEPVVDQAGSTDLAAEAHSMVVVAIHGDQVEMLTARLIGLVGPDPASRELRQLLDEVARYTDLRLLAQRGQVLPAVQLREKKFTLPELEEAARLRVDPALGSADRIAALTAAEEAWAEGELIEALNGLKLLARQGDPVAEAMLTHYAAVVEDYERLRGGRAAARELQLFYLGLDPAKDSFFWRNLEGDMTALTEPAARDAGQALGEAGVLWVRYQDHGGIDSALRQGVAGGDGYRQRAALLVEANRLIADLGSGDAELENSLFPQLLAQELAHQRGQLFALQKHSDEKLWQERIELLAGRSAQANR